MKVALMQPMFMPWQGYFALIGSVDKFIFLDDFQFSRSTFDHRNRLFMPGGKVGFYTVPISRERGLSCTYNQARPVIHFRNLKKIFSSLRQAYATTEYYDWLIGYVHDWLSEKRNNLADLNIAFISMITTLLQIKIEFDRSSRYRVEGKRSEKVLSLLRQIGAKYYLAARGSFDYMLKDGIFPVQDIETCFQNFTPVAYQQVLNGRFISHLSILDSLFRIGPDATRKLIEAGSREPMPWDEMIRESTL